MEIAARLDERFRLLTGGRRVSVERHHTLRATVDWSYSLLNPTEQGVFDRLGTFPATFDAAAAEAVAGVEGIEAWDVLDALTSLVAKSMLVADQSAEGKTRYQMLESLRHYARERLDATGSADAIRRLHAQHYTTIAAEIGRRLQRSRRGDGQVSVRGRARQPPRRGALGARFDARGGRRAGSAHDRRACRHRYLGTGRASARGRSRPSSGSTAPTPAIAVSS